MMSDEFKIVMRNVDGKISCVAENIQVLENLYKENTALKAELAELRKAGELLEQDLTRTIEQRDNAEQYAVNF